MSPGGSRSTRSIRASLGLVLVAALLIALLSGRHPGQAPSAAEPPPESLAPATLALIEPEPELGVGPGLESGSPALASGRELAGVLEASAPLELPPGVLEFVVVGGTSRAYRSVTATLEPLDLEAPAQLAPRRQRPSADDASLSLSAHDGTGRFENLPSGRYRLWIHGHWAGFLATPSPAFTLREVGRRIELTHARVPLEQGVFGRLIPPQGEPLPVISVEFLSGRTRCSAYSGRSGHFFATLPEGSLPTTGELWVLPSHTAYRRVAGRSAEYLLEQPFAVQRFVGVESGIDQEFPLAVGSWLELHVTSTDARPQLRASLIGCDKQLELRVVEDPTETLVV